MPLIIIGRAFLYTDDCASLSHCFTLAIMRFAASRNRFVTRGGFDVQSIGHQSSRAMSWQSGSRQKEVEAAI